jgi:molecular chaperone GrpE
MSKPNQAIDSNADTLPLVPDLIPELNVQKDRTLRLQAEMENLRGRQSRELADERRYGALNLMREILPVLDNMDRAIEAAEKSGDGGPLLDGIQLVRQQLVTALAQNGCEPIEALGQPFNPDLHAAILQQPSPDYPAGHVMHVTQTGYKLHDRVVRPAAVIVSSGQDRSDPGQ